MYDVVSQFEDFASPVEPANNNVGLERSKESELKIYAESKHSKVRAEGYSQSES